MLATDQQDFLIYTSELKSNYSRGIKKLKNILNTPSLAGEFVNNLGAVSVVLGTEESAEDGNSKELFDILYASPYYSDAVETWLKGSFAFDDINLLLRDSSTCEAILNDPILYPVVARDNCTVYAKLICGLAGLDPADYDDITAFNALKDESFITTAVMSAAGIDKPYTTMSQILSNPDDLAAFIGSTKAVSIAACSECAMDALTKNTTAMRILINDEDALRTISQISVGMNALANNSEFIRELVKNNAACLIVADSEIGMYAIMNSTAAMDDELTTVIDHTIGSATAMAAMAKSKNALMIIATNSGLLAKVIASPVAMNAILTNYDGLDYFVTFNKAFQAMYENETVRNSIYANKMAIKTISKNTEAMDNISDATSIRDAFLGKCVCALVDLEPEKYTGFSNLYDSTNLTVNFPKLLLSDDAMIMICNSHWMLSSLVTKTEALDMVLASEIGLKHFQETSESMLVKVIGTAVGLGSYSFWSLDRIVDDDEHYKKLTNTNAGLKKMVPHHHLIVAAIMANDKRRNVIYNASTETDPLIANIDTKVGAKAIAELINLDPMYNYDLELVTDIDYFTTSYANMIVLNEHIKAYETAMAITAIANAIKAIDESVMTKMIASWSELNPDDYNLISDFLADFHILAQVYEHEEAVTAIYDNENARTVIGAADNIIVGKAAAEVAGMGGDNYANIAIICTQGPNIGALMDNSHSMDLIVATTAGMMAVVNSDLAMNALLGRNDCLRKVINNEVATRILAGNSNAMNLFAKSADAYDIMLENLTATEIITSTPNAMAAISKNKEGLNIILGDIEKLTAYVNDQSSMEGASTDSIIMNILAANSTAVNQIIASDTALGILADAEIAMNVLAGSTVAMPLLAASSTAMTTIFDSSVATKVMVTSPNAMTNIAKQNNAVAALIASDNATMQAANSDIAIKALVGSTTAMTKFVASEAAMEIIADSHAAFSAIMANTTALNKVLGSATAMGVIANSGNAMSLLVSNQTAMTAIWANTTARDTIMTTTSAMTLVVGSKTAMETLANNADAVDKLIATNAAWQAVLDNFDAITSFLNVQAAVQKLSVNNATAANAFNLLVKSLNGKKAFNRSPYRATYYSQFSAMMAAQTGKFTTTLAATNRSSGSSANIYVLNSTNTGNNAGANLNPSADNSVIVFIGSSGIYNTSNGTYQQEIRDIPNNDVIVSGAFTSTYTKFNDMVLGGIKWKNTYAHQVAIYTAK